MQIYKVNGYIIGDQDLRESRVSGTIAQGGAAAGAVRGWAS
jgi:hypothetical protein